MKKLGFKFGLKVASQDWFWKYDLSYDKAIEKLKSMGVDFIIAQGSRFIPSANTAIQSEIPKEMEYKLESYDDRVFRKKLEEAGIECFGAVRFGFAEESMDKYGNYAINQHGKPAKKIDWYIGPCPTCDEYNEERVALAENAMKELNLDGFFLGFMRYPGFWEMWLPDTDGESWSEYCFCSRCIEKFQQFSGIQVPEDKGMTKGQWIRANVREQWTSFKCQVIHDIIGNFRNRIHKYNPEAKIMLNTVPFDQAHYGNYGKSMFGQDPKMLADVVDVFEMMGYHQILGQPYQWISEAGKYFKKISGKVVVCTVQGKALYTEGIHKGKGRQEEITPEEFKNALHSIKNADIDGAIVFTWSNFLRAEYEENNKVLVNIVSTFTGSKE